MKCWSNHITHTPMHTHICLSYGEYNLYSVGRDEWRQSGSLLVLYPLSAFRFRREKTKRVSEWRHSLTHSLACASGSHSVCTIASRHTLWSGGVCVCVCVYYLCTSECQRADYNARRELKVCVCLCERVIKGEGSQGAQQQRQQQQQHQWEQHCQCAREHAWAGMCAWGVEGRGEADAAGLPGEEEGVGERTQPLFSAAGEAGTEDAAAVGPADTRGMSVPFWRRASAWALTQDVPNKKVDFQTEPHTEGKRAVPLCIKHASLYLFRMPGRGEE